MYKMMSEFERSLAVVIGINKYQNGIARLQTAVPDAIAIAEILLRKYQYELINPKFFSVVFLSSNL
ncbi:Caspase domain-containing protein [Xenococcus sp. PCC 7305]|uniref:caspase family protein n=1 Tax=Xenococcus sp. PCC 7305 TaxID=102125 RepID=UPI0002AB9EAB|nr:caspase family protein [Xenococcus sp. PCC 7305]ELS00528.1 Caspase domain-containing protein [Xenococcus sp. PCC 7305]